MKKALLLTVAAFFFTFQLTESQDRQPSLWAGDTASLKYNGVVLNPNNPEFSASQNNMLYGFEWYGMSTFGKALGINISWDNYPTCNSAQNPLRPYGVYFGLNPANLTPADSARKQTIWKYATAYFFGCQSLTFDPRLRVGYEYPKIHKGLDGNNPAKKQSVFGFRYFSPYINLTSDTVNERLRLNRNIFYGTPPVILNKPWPNNRFKAVHTAPNVDHANDRWYLTVHLSRANCPACTTHTNQTILELRVKGWYKQDSAHTAQSEYLAFTELPQHNLSNMTLLKSKGDTIRWEQYGYQIDSIFNHTEKGSTVLRISDDMLPINNFDYKKNNFSGSNDIHTKDITISAMFYTKNPIPFDPNFPYPNRECNVENLGVAAGIYGVYDSLDVEVTYLGGNDILLDYVRLDNEPGYHMMNGESDVHVYKDIAGTLSSIQYDNDSWSNHPYKLNRLFGECLESTDNYEMWAALRRLNQISNDMFISQDNFGTGNLYHHFTRNTLKYTGFRFGTGNWGQSRAPYIRTGLENPATMNLKQGYAARSHFPDSANLVTYNIDRTDSNHSEYRIDSLQSNYETMGTKDNYAWGYIGADDPSYNKTPDERRVMFYENPLINKDLSNPTVRKDYLNVLPSGSGVQSEIEWGIYSSFFDPNNGQDLFGDSPWYTISGINASIKTYPFNPILTVHQAQAATFMYNRPNTGEEINLLLFEPLVYGGKGTIFDGEANQRMKSPPIHSIPEQAYGAQNLRFPTTLETLVNYTDPENRNFDTVNYPTGWNYMKYFDYSGNTWSNDQADVDNTDNNDDGLKDNFSWDLADPFMRIGSTQKLSDHDMIYDDRIGGDFFNKSIDGINLYPYLYSTTTPQDTNGLRPWTWMKIRPDRLYLGLMSTRIQIKKIIDWSRYNSNTLLNLRLVAAVGKGYSRWYTQNPNLTQADYISNFIDVSGIRTRKTYDINRNTVNYNSGLFAKYPWEGRKEYNFQDSSFFDVTLHKNVAQDTTMKNIWYVALVNRRTDPLVIMSNGGSGRSVNFYSAAEWDHNMDYGGPTFIAGNPTLTAAQWQALLWRRFGAREILLPFSYINPADTNEYCLLHVTEMMDSSAYNASWPYWRKERWNRRIDTIIGQNSQLAMKFQPSEGKFLKVEVLHPDKITGDLAYSNQHKLVVWPATNPNPPYNSGIRYHLTYQVANHIYYSRSQFIVKDSINEVVRWEPYIRVDQYIQYKKSDGSIDSVNFNNKTNAYPSIIVRDQGSNTYASIVYRCDSSRMFNCPGMITLCNGTLACRDSLYKPIVESVLDVKGAVSTLIRSFVINNYTLGSNRDNYGQPVVSACKTGNFYAWSDSACGIIVGFKSPLDWTFKTMYTLRSYFPFTANPLQAQHPSITPYNAKNECGIVWQENVMVQGEPQGIMFTNLRFDSIPIPGIITKFMADTVKMSGWFYNDKIAMVSNDKTGYNTMPVITSSSKSRVYQMDGLNLTTYDANIQTIFWQNFNGIHMPYIRFEIDNANLNNKWTTGGIFTKSTLSTPSGISVIYRYGSGQYITVNSPHAAMGSIIKPDTLYGVNRANFERANVVYNQTTGTIPNVNDKVIIQDYPTLLSASISVPSIKIKYLSNVATNPHLSVTLDGSIYNEVWKNRVIKQVGGANPGLAVSGDKFYKSSLDVDGDAEFWTGFTANNDMLYYITLPSVNGNYISLKLPYTEERDTSGALIYLKPTYSDTVYSDWFVVNNSAELSYKTMIHDTSTVYFKLQKQSDGTYTNIPRTPSPDWEMGFQVYWLVNGQGNNYRLVMINKDTASGMFETKWYLGGVPMLDTIYAKMGKTINTINLNSGNTTQNDSGITLIAFPNPAQNQIFVKGDLPTEIFLNTPNSRVTNRISYKLFNSLGIEMGIYSGNSGETIEIPTIDYGEGVYFIRAEIESNYFSRYDATPAVKTIVIER